MAAFPVDVADGADSQHRGSEESVDQRHGWDEIKRVKEAAQINQRSDAG